MRLLRHNLHINHIDELGEIGRNETSIRFLRIDDNRHARNMRLVGAPYSEAVHVEVTAAEQAGDTIQDTRLILHERDNRVLVCRLCHAFTSPGLGRRIILSRAAPAATIGYTISSFSITYSISTGPSWRRANSTDSAICSRLVTRIAGMP